MKNNNTAMNATIFDAFQNSIHDYIQGHKGEIVDTIKELLRIPSVKGEAEENAPFGRECARVLEFTQKLYENYGFATELDDLYKDLKELHNYNLT